MVELGVLGTGGATATADRDNTAFLVRSGRLSILVDCPGGIVQKLKKLGARPSELDAIFLTHVHPDHVYGLPSLVHSMMLEEAEIPLFGSAGTVDLARRLLDQFGLLDPRYKTRLRFGTLAPSGTIALGGWGEVRAVPVIHHPSSLAYRFELTGGPGLFISGDTAADPRLWRECAREDWMCHDCSAPERVFGQYPVLYDKHTNAFDLGRLAEERGVAALIPVHFFGEIEFGLDEIEEDIRRSYRGRLIMPRDLGVYPMT